MAFCQFYLLAAEKQGASAKTQSGSYENIIYGVEGALQNG
jgi:hypothetical protein